MLTIRAWPLVLVERHPGEEMVSGKVILARIKIILTTRGALVGEVAENIAAGTATASGRRQQKVLAMASLGLILTEENLVGE